MRIAVLDLGSNSFRLLVAAGGPGPTIFHLRSDRAMLNLGAEVGRHGRITDPAAEAAVRTVAGFRTEVEAAEVDRVVAVATSAFRVAANGAEVLQRLSRAAGVPVRLIDGEEEARLAFAGMRASIALGSATALGLDLGGGSLDLAVGTAGHVSWAGSAEIGVSRLAGELVRSDPLARPERRALRRRVRASLDEVAGTIRALEPSRCVAIGGTARALARLVAFARWGERPPSINQLSIGAEELAGLADRLALAGRKARTRIPGMDPRRVDLIPVGAVIVSTVLEHLGFADVTVSEWGLREGLVLRTLGLDGSAEGLRRAAVDRLAGPAADPHAERVGRLAVQLFDATAPLHGLSGADRELLEHAARLHDLGARNGHADAQHKAGASILERAGMRGFSPEEVATLAGLVRNQRGQPKLGRPPLGRLGPDRLDAALRLLAMLRFAHAVERAPGGEVRSLAVRASRPGVAVELETDGGSELDLRDVTRELTALEAAIGVTVEVHVPLVVAASA